MYLKKEKVSHYCPVVNSQNLSINHLLIRVSHGSRSAVASASEMTIESKKTSMLSSPHKSPHPPPSLLCSINGDNANIHLSPQLWPLGAQYSAHPAGLPTLAIPRLYTMEQTLNSKALPPQNICKKQTAGRNNGNWIPRGGSEIN